MHTVRALVVYESMFGNTEQVAGAVARGLRLEGIDTSLVEVGSAPTEVGADVGLLVLGGPTHAFGMSRPRTRQEAVAQGGSADRAAIGIREWLSVVRLDPAHTPDVAAFDTRVTKVRRLPQAAGPSVARAARRRGLATIAKPKGFLVDDISGPLVADEPERAVAWGRELGTLLVDRAAAAVR